MAHEIGVNTYNSSEDFQVQVAEDYWNETKAFWAEIRAEWRKLHQQLGTFKLQPSSQSGKLYNQILLLAKEAREGKLDMETAAMRARDLIRNSTTTHVAEFKSPVRLQDEKR